MFFRKERRIDYQPVLNRLEELSRDGVERGVERFLEEHPEVEGLSREELLRLLEREGERGKLGRIDLWLGVWGFLIGVGTAFWVLGGGRVHINLYLAFSVVIPLVLTILSGVSIATFFNSPTSAPTGWFGTLIGWGSKIAKGRWATEKLEVIGGLQIGGVGYILGFSVVATLIFLFKKVQFYYESTFTISPELEQRIIDLFSFPYSWLYPHPPEVSNLEGTPVAMFLLLVGIFWVGIPRLLVYLLFKLQFPRVLERLVEGHPLLRLLDEKLRETQVVSSTQNQEFHRREREGSTSEEESRESEEGPEKKGAPKPEVEERGTGDAGGEWNGEKGDPLEVPLNLPTPDTPIHLLFYQSDREWVEEVLPFLDQRRPVVGHRFNYFGQSDRELQQIIENLEGEVVFVVEARKDIIPNGEFIYFLREILKNRKVEWVQILLWDQGPVAPLSYPNYPVWEQLVNRPEFKKVELIVRGRR